MSRAHLRELDRLTARYKLFRILSPSAKFKVRPNGKVRHTPRIPKHTMDFEDREIPRVCVGPTIRHCVAALTVGEPADVNIWSFEDHIGSHVFALRRVPRSYRKPGKKLVPDAPITKEGWITRPIHMEYLGRLAIEGTTLGWHDIDGRVVIVPPGQKLPKLKYER